MYLAAAEKVIGEAFRTAAVRAAAHEPADRHGPSVPSASTSRLCGRRATTRPCRTLVATADPDLERQQHIYNILLAFADRAFRRPATHDEMTALARHRPVGREGRRAPGGGTPARAAGRAGVAPFPVPADTHDHDAGRRPPRLPDRRLRPGLSALVLPLEQHARRASSFGWPRRDRCVARRPSRPGQADAPRSQGRAPWRRTSPASGSRRASSRTFTPDPALFPDFDDALEGGDASRRRGSSSTRSETRTAACWSSSTRTTRS